MSWTVVPWLFRAADGRPMREIEADIREELESHLALSAAALAGEGLSVEDARREAERRFGDLERARRECRRVHVGARAVAHVPALVAGALLVAGLSVLGWQQASWRRESRIALQRLDERLALLGSVPPKEDDNRLSPDAIVAETNASESWRQAYGAATRVAALPSDLALAFVSDVFPRLRDAKDRQQFLKAFAFARKPNVLQVLHLGATDADPSVRGWAFEYLEDYTFRDFSAEPEKYAAWWADWGDKPLSEALAANARLFVARAAELDEADVKALFDVPRFRDFPDERAGHAAGIDLPAVMRQAGALSLGERWLASSDEQVRACGATWLVAVRPDEAFAKRVVFPLLARGEALDDDTARGLARSLGVAGQSWAVPALAEALARTPAREYQRQLWIADSLAKIGDPAAVPALIASLVDKEREPMPEDVLREVRHAHAHYGLRPLTGVVFDPARGASWWHAWWQQHREELPPEISAVEVPPFHVP